MIKRFENNDLRKCLKVICVTALPSTMLDLAMNPDEAFRAPLKTTKLAPVTANERWGPVRHPLIKLHNKMLHNKQLKV